MSETTDTGVNVFCPVAELKYGNDVITVANLPGSSIVALLNRGITRYLGNEQASKVSAAIDKIAIDSGVCKADDKAGLEAHRKAFPADKREAMLAEAVAAAIVAMHEGNMGVGSRGPRGTAQDTIEREIAWEEISRILRDNGMDIPSGKATVRTPDGAFTKAELIARRLERDGERIAREAVARMKRAEKAASGLSAL